jgi:hypothetical protein
MAVASTTYVLETGSTFKTTPMTSAVAISYDITSSPTSVTADGSRHVLDQFVDQIQANIRVECLDAGLLTTTASFYPGQSGILICKCKLRTVGSTTTTVGTITFAEAVYVGSQVETPNDGVGRLVLNFVAASSDDNGLIKMFAWS